MERLVLTARLRQGAYDRALELAAAEMPTHPSVSAFERLSVYMSESEVVFLIEAPDAELLVRRILNDPVRAGEVSPCYRSSTARSTARLRSITGLAPRQSDDRCRRRECD